MAMKFSKCTTPFHIIYLLDEMTEIPLGMHLRTIRVEKFHTKTVSILSVLMFEKCRFRENCPFVKMARFVKKAFMKTAFVKMAISEASFS